MLMLKYRSKYRNDFSISIGRITVLFKASFGRNCFEEVDAFFIPKIEHFSTIIIRPMCITKRNGLAATGFRFQRRHCLRIEASGWIYLILDI